MTENRRPDRCLLCEARLNNPVCQLPPTVVERFSRFTSVSNVDGGTTLFRQGESCPDLYLIRTGQVKLTFEYPDGAEQLLRVAGPGEAIGLTRTRLAMGGPSGNGLSGNGSGFGTPVMPVTAITKGSASLCRARLKDVEHLLQTDPDFALAWAHLLIDEVQRARESVFHLGPQPAAIRLVRFLQDALKRQPRQNSARMPNSVPMTHAELAAALSVAQETITRLLRDLEEKNVVRLARGRIEVLDPERLEALAGHEEAAQGAGGA